MKEQFVTYEIALKLKELGFDEKCFGYYTPMKDWMMKGKYSDGKLHFHGPNWANLDNTFYFMYKPNSFGDRTETVNNSNFTKAIHNIAVPLWQQVIDWFHEKYNLCIYWKPNRPNIGDTEYFIENQFEEVVLASQIYMFPDQAREFAILKAIELIKNNK